ncbi:MAG: glycosyltransferase family protein [bacterium]|nr:glycosyltransferase family protein [bacterium]MDZ4345017.1 glycosyltransferase family protein [Candidatus Binatia bacterium]
MTKTLCIIQARMSSTRLPGKVLKEVSGASLIEHEIRKLKMARLIDKIVLATTTGSEDDRLVGACRRLEIDCFRGSKDDVLGRYLKCAKQFPEYDVIIRATGDCPLIDPGVADNTIFFFKSNNYDYVSNSNPPTFPDGMDIEVFSRQSLEKADREAQKTAEREHVTLYIRESGKFKIGNFIGDKDYSKYRLTVDNPEDFEVIKAVIENFNPDSTFLDYIDFLEGHPDIMAKNMSIKRNEGLIKSLNKEKI